MKASHVFGAVDVRLVGVRDVLIDFEGVQEGCVVVDYRQDEGYVTPKEAAGEDMVYVSRIREDITAENALAFWCVADNLRKGAALNAVQIAEKLIELEII